MSEELGCLDISGSGKKRLRYKRCMRHFCNVSVFNIVEESATNLRDMLTEIQTEVIFILFPTEQNIVTDLCHNLL